MGLRKVRASGAAKGDLICGLLPIIAMVGVFLVLLVCVALPLYSDEVEWKWMESRAFLDRGLVLNIFPQNQLLISSPIPLVEWPFRIWDALVYGDLGNLLKIRILGIGSFLLWLWFLCWATPKSLALRVQSWRLFGVLASCFSLGVLLPLMVWNRPEQNLLWGLGFVVSLPLIDFLRFSWLKRGSVRVIMLLWVGAGILAYHPKGLIFLPLVMLAAGYMLSSRGLRVLVIAMLLIFAATEIHSWNDRLRIPEDGKGAVAYQMLNARILIHDPAFFFKQVASNANTSIYFQQLRFGQTYFNHWLPDGPPLGPVSRAVNVALNLAFVGVQLAAASCVIYAAFCYLRSRMLSFSMAMGAGLAIQALVLVLMQTVKNAYDGEFLYSILVLSCVLVCLSQEAQLRLWRYKRGIAFLGMLLAILSILSSALLLQKMVPSFRKWTQGGYLAGQSLSFSAFHSSEENSKTLALARQCGIDALDHSQSLLLDDVTISAFFHTARPFYAGYAKGLARNTGISFGESEKIFRRQGYVGIVANCEYLPGGWRRAAYSLQDRCCVRFDRDLSDK